MITKLGPVRVGNNNPVRVMGIINTSPESFFKKSIKKTRQAIQDTVLQMQEDGVDIIDVGAMSTAPYLDTIIPDKTESVRITQAVKAIQDVSNLPVSIDTCRATVAKQALELGVDIINDISGLKYDPQMTRVLSLYDQTSVVLCAYNKSTIRGSLLTTTKDLLKQSIALAKDACISKDRIVLDPSIGFFRKTGKNPFFTRIKSDWVRRDITTIQNLSKLKIGRHPLLVSVSNKSFIGKLLDVPAPSDRIIGSVVAEAFCVLNGANVIRTHNVAQTRHAIKTAVAFSKLS